MSYFGDDNDGHDGGDSFGNKSSGCLELAEKSTARKWLGPVVFNLLQISDYDGGLDGDGRDPEIMMWSYDLWP